MPAGITGVFFHTDLFHVFNARLNSSSPLSHVSHVLEMMYGHGCRVHSGKCAPFLSSVCSTRRPSAAVVSSSGTISAALATRSMPIQLMFGAGRGNPILASNRVVLTFQDSRLPVFLICIVKRCLIRERERILDHVLLPACSCKAGRRLRFS